MKEIELLSPAKDYECGVAAINSGADAVYIGGPKFGARINAGNKMEDIRKLIDYAHRYRVKIYVTVNTILFDNELEEARKVIYDVYEMGADAVIIQDFGLLELDLPPIALFASTQMHNYSLERIAFLEKVGLKRVILARELSLKEIEKIKSETNIDLEFFIHGALCVCFSGQCYFSQAINKGSANRGNCSQPCRMTYDLVDKNNKVLVKDKYLLSPKDLNLSQHISELIKAGITSFKIEGRLKDRNYVKNVTAFYRQKIDEVILKDKSLKRASVGKSYFDFVPNPYKSFNRGFTSYFIDNRNPEMISLDTEKSIGEKIGTVKSAAPKYFTLKEKNDLHNGDGICFFNDGILSGININKVEDGKVYLSRMIELKPGTVIYRNYDSQFEKSLENKNTPRKISLDMEFGEYEEGFYLLAIDEEGIEAEYKMKCEKVPAKDVLQSFETIKKQISSLGNTIYEISSWNLRLEKGYFLNFKVLNEMRREFIRILDEKRKHAFQRKTVKIIPNDYPFPETELFYKANIANKEAERFMQRHGAVLKEKAFELLDKPAGKEIMTTKYCIRYQFEECPKIKKGKTLDSFPWYLVNNQKRFKLEFDCIKCEMKIIPE